MSMLSNSGASATAQEIMHFIIQELVSVETGTKEHELLMRVYEFAKAIKEDADSGWY